MDMLLVLIQLLVEYESVRIVSFLLYMDTSSICFMH